MNNIAVVAPETLAKILRGEKTVESRLARNRPVAWSVQAGELIYFKPKGGDIGAVALAEAVHRFDGLDLIRLMELEREWWPRVHGETRNLAYWLGKRYSRYAVLIELACVERVHIPTRSLPPRLPWASAWIRIADDLIEAPPVPQRTA